MEASRRVSSMRCSKPRGALTRVNPGPWKQGRRGIRPQQRCLSGPVKHWWKARGSDSTRLLCVTRLLRGASEPETSHELPRCRVAPTMAGEAQVVPQGRKGSHSGTRCSERAPSAPADDSDGSSIHVRIDEGGIAVC